MYFIDGQAVAGSATNLAHTVRLAKKTAIHFYRNNFINRKPRPARAASTPIPIRIPMIGNPPDFFAWRSSAGGAP